jgi:hypothetical protein
MIRRFLVTIVFSLIMLPGSVLAQADLEITAPLPVSELADTVAVRGTVNLPDLQQYFLEVAVFGEEPAQWIPASLPRSEPVINDVLLVWDTRTLPDGVYRLRLHAITCDGEHHFAEVAPLRLANGLTCPIELPDAPLCRVELPSQPSIVQPTTPPTTPPADTTTLTDTTTPTDIPAPTSLTSPTLSTAPTLRDADSCEDFSASFSVDMGGFEMPWDAFRQGAFYAYDDDIPFLDEEYDVIYETHVDSGDVWWESIITNDTHWESILDRLPLWIDFDTPIYTVEGYTLDVAPNHTRTYSDLQMMRVLIRDFADSMGIDQLEDDMRQMLEDEADDIDREMENMHVYSGELKTVDRHTNSNVVEMTIMVQAVYDEDGLLMGAFLVGEYGDCIGCAGELGGRFRVFDGLGWMVTLERTQTNLPPAQCRQAFFGAADTTTPEMAVPQTATSALCPPLPDFYGTYETTREGVAIGWGGGQVLTIDDMPSQVYDQQANTAFLDISGMTASIPAYTFEGDFPMGGEYGDMIYHASNIQEAYTVTRTGEETMSIMGQNVTVLVYEGERQTSIAITSPIMSGTLNRTEQHRYYVDAQSGLILKSEIEGLYTTCNICNGQIGDYHNAIVGHTYYETMTLINTNQPLGTCP